MKKISKKIIVGISVLGLFLCVIFYAWPTVNNPPCAFCNQQVIQSHTFYEDDLVRGLCTHKPLQPYHCLIVIKRHITRIEDSTKEEILAAFLLIQKINSVIQKINGPSSYILLEKNGVEVGQTVPHVHIHYIPKKISPQKNLSTFGLLWSFLLSPFQKPIPQEKLALTVKEMKKEFSIKLP